MNNKYPEHEKLKAVRTQHMAICEFLSWLDTEKGYNLTERESGCTVRRQFADIIAEFFGIDVQKFEKEKCEMLEELRNTPKTPA